MGNVINYTGMVGNFSVTKSAGMSSANEENVRTYFNNFCVDIDQYILGGTVLNVSLSSIRTYDNITILTTSVIGSFEISYINLEANETAVIGAFKTFCQNVDKYSGVPVEINVVTSKLTPIRTYTET